MDTKDHKNHGLIYVKVLNTVKLIFLISEKFMTPLPSFAVLVYCYTNPSLLNCFVLSVALTQVFLNQARSYSVLGPLLSLTGLTIYMAQFFKPILP